MPLSSDTGYDFYKVIVFSRNQLIQQFLAIDFHNAISIFMFMDIS